MNIQPGDYIKIAILLAIIAVLSFSLITVCMGWRAPVDWNSGYFVVRFSPPWRVFAVLVGVVAPLGFDVISFVFPPNPGQWLMVELMLLGINLLGWFAVSGAFHARVEVSPHGLVSHTGFWWSVTMTWDEVREVRHVNPGTWFLFTSHRGYRIGMPLIFTGLDLVVAAMRTFLPPEVYAPAVPGFRLVTGEPFVIPPATSPSPEPHDDEQC